MGPLDGHEYKYDLCWIVKRIKQLQDQITTLQNQDEDHTNEINNLQQQINDLKKYVIDYFKNLDVTDEINNKLDDMLEDGSLADIINNQILSDFFDLGSSFNYDMYKSQLLNNGLSYMMNSIGCPSIQGTPTRSRAFLAKYQDGNTYMGLLGQGTFNYTDTEQYEGTNYPVFYIDCSGFVSLLTKNISYENSPYYTGFGRGTPTARSAQASGDFWTDLFTMDFSNKIITYQIAQICEGMGMPLKILGTWDTDLEPNLSNIQWLRTGDIIFFGRSNLTSRYKGIHHCAIYLKDLTDINNLATQYGITIVPYLHENDNEEYGYILHVDGDDGDGTVIKIETLYHRMQATTATEYTWGCRAYPTIGTSNKFNTIVLGIFYYYNIMAITGKYAANYDACISNYPPSVPYVDENFTLHTNNFDTTNIAIGRGSRIPNNTDLNNLATGIWFCDSISDAQTLTNAPFEAAFFLQYLGQLESSGNYGVQIAYSYAGTSVTPYTTAYRIKYYNGTWSAWFLPEISSPLRFGTLLSNNTNLNSIEDGIYVSENATTSGSLQNAPWSNAPFYLEQKGSLTDPDRYGIQQAFSYSGVAVTPKFYAFRIRTADGTWGSWYYVTANTSPSE